MSPLQHKKLEHLINTGRHAAARKFLDELVVAGDKEAKTLRADMEATYPVSSMEKADKVAKKFLLYLVAGICILIIVIVVIALIQYIQAAPNR